MFTGITNINLPNNYKNIEKEDYEKALKNLDIDFAIPIVTLLIYNADKEIEEKIKNLKDPKTDLEKYIYKSLKSSKDL